MTARVLVLGAGSIGRRHASNLAALGADVAVCDADAARAAGIAGCESITFAAAAGSTFDGIVVASPTACHAEHCGWALDRARSVFVEKPIALTVAETADLEPHLERIMVGYNLRLVPGVADVVTRLHTGALGEPRSVRVWFGQRLSDWRPGVDYRTTYSASKALGGGILLDAIHELDLLVWMLGRDGWSVRGAVVDRRGDLEIDAEDTVEAILLRGDVVATVDLDYLSPGYRRGIEIVGTTSTVRLDWSAATIAVGDASGWSVQPSDLDVHSAYVAEAAAFLAMIEGAAPPVGGAEGIASLLLAELIRSAAEERER